MPVKQANFMGPEYIAEQQEIERRKALAAMLTQQGLQQSPTEQVGGWAVRQPKLGGLTKVAQVLAGQLGQQQAGEEQKELGQRMVGDRQTALANAIRTAQGAPGQAPEDAAGNLQPAQPASPGNPQAAMMQLAGAGDPMLAQFGMQGLMQGMTPQAGFTLGPEQVRYGPDGKPIATGPARPAAPPAESDLAKLQREMAALAPNDPRLLDYRAKIAKLVSHAPAPSATATAVMGKDDDEYLKVRRRQQAEGFAKLETGAESAYKRQQSLDRFIEASKKGAAGGAQPLITATQTFLSSFGYTPEALKDVRMMEQAIGDMLGNKMQELGARGLTDRDMDILRQALPRVNVDAASREAVAAVLKKADDHTIGEYINARKEEARIYPEFAKKTPKQAWLRSYEARSSVGAPTGVDQALWDAMTPEEKALWRK